MSRQGKKEKKRKKQSNIYQTSMFELNTELSDAGDLSCELDAQSSMAFGFCVRKSPSSLLHESVEKDRSSILWRKANDKIRLRHMTNDTLCILITTTVLLYKTA